uniref:PSI domain-containing protein n=1 Tax=Amphiprion percula TaxID=161767 RepID=A0A3P8TJ29_AMPPE
MSTVYAASVSVFVLIFCVFILATEAQSSTPAPAPVPCADRSNRSCSECLQNVTCLWCTSTERCVDYPVRNILPPNSLCPLNDARWGVCWVNFQILIITMSVLAGVIIIAILVCCFCCCKCERMGAASVLCCLTICLLFVPLRRTEMQLRHDEIRQKYGLAKDNPYARMDDH